tara:strand:+ start:781 stop:1089 length:309 start_codon:yes stop_codon:yes gene_type:complete
MKPVPLHVVRYFKGEETRMISKHLNREPALQVAQRFIDNLLQKQTSLQEGDELKILTHDEGDVTTHRLQNNTTHSVSDEGVVVFVETQKQPDWDYPFYTPPT